MYLTRREYEAFVRSRAAGLIPQDCPVPEDETRADELIFHIGVTFSETVGCRTGTGQLFFLGISAFSEEYLPEILRKLPKLHPAVSQVTPLRRKEHLPPLEALAGYFALGPEVMDEKDIAARLAVYNPGLTVSDIRKGFELAFGPEKVSGLADAEQRMLLSERIVQRAIPPIPRRIWENLTAREAAEILAKKHPESRIPTAVRTAVRSYDRLTPEEKILFRELTTRKRERKT